MAISTEDDELGEKRKPTKLGCYLEGLGPIDSLVRTVLVVMIRGGSGGKSAMQMGNSSDVPGTRGEGACQEAVGVDDVGGDHVHDLLGKPGGRGRTLARGVLRSTLKESFHDSGQRSVPDTLGGLFGHCSGEQRDTMIR